MFQLNEIRRNHLFFCLSFDSQKENDSYKIFQKTYSTVHLKVREAVNKQRIYIELLIFPLYLKYYGISLRVVSELF